MPMHFQILKQHRLILCFPTGTVTQSCVLDYFDRARADPDYEIGMDRLIDNRNLVSLDFGYAEMRNIRAKEIAVILQSPRRIKTAILVRNDSGYGMARMYQSLVEASGDHDVSIFFEADQALAFLGLAPGVLDDIESPA